MGLFCVSEHMVKGSDSALEIIYPPKRTEFIEWLYLVFCNSSEGNMIKNGDRVCRTYRKKISVFVTFSFTRQVSKF